MARNFWQSTGNTFIFTTIVRYLEVAWMKVILFSWNDNSLNRVFLLLSGGHHYYNRRNFLMTVTGEKSCFFSSSGLPAYKENKPKKIKKTCNTAWKTTLKFNAVRKNKRKQIKIWFLACTSRQLIVKVDC